MPVFQLELDTTKLSQGAANATRSLDGLVRASDVTQKSVTANFDAIKNSANSTTQVLVSLAQKASAALGAGFTVGQSISEFARFQSALVGMSKVTDENLSVIDQRIRSVSAELGSSTQLMQGYYQVISAGVTDPIKSFDMLTTASKAAKAAGVSQSETIIALTKLMAGYSGAIADAADASDVLFAIERVGQTSVAQLVPYIGDLASISNQAKVSVAEMGATFSAMTQTAGGTSQAATQYRAVLMGLVKEQSNMSAVVKQLGYESATAIVEQNGLAKALMMIAEQGKKAGFSFGQLFESSEALTALGPLFETSFKTVLDNIQQIENRGGATFRAFGRYTETITGQMDTLSNSFSNLNTNIGEKFGSETLTALHAANSSVAYLTENLDSLSRVATTVGVAMASVYTARQMRDTITPAIKERIDTIRSYGTEIVEAGKKELESATITAKAAEAQKQAAFVALQNAAAEEKYTASVGKKIGITVQQESAFRRLVVAEKNYAAASTKSSLATSALAEAMKKAASPMNAFKNVGGGLLNILGGPWGLAFTAASTVAYSLYTSSKNAESATSALSEAFIKENAAARLAAGGLAEVEVTTKNIAEAASRMKLGKAQEVLRGAQNSIESFIKPLRLKENEVFGASFFTDSFHSEAQKKAMQIVNQYYNRVLDTEKAVGLLNKGMEKYGNNNKYIIEAYRLITAEAKAIQDANSAQESLNESTSVTPENIKSAKEQADALTAQWKEFDKLTKEASMQGVVTDLESATRFALDLIGKSNAGAEAQAWLKKEAQGATRIILEEALAAAQLSGVFERIAATQSLLNRYNAAVASGVKKSGSGATSSADSARASLVALREEIERLAGRGSDAEVAITKKANEIEKLGKSANLSAPEITNLKHEFNAAFATDTLRKFDDELLKISGNTSAIQAAEMARDIEKWTLQLNALVDAGQLSQEAAAQRLAEYKVSLEKQVDFKDAQAASQFMRELNELSGDYNMGKEEALKLLDLEAEMYRQKLPAAMHGYIGQWKELKRLQNSRDAMDGLERGFRKYTDEATNAAKETERLSYDMAKGMEDSLTDMVMNVGGKSKSVMDSLRGMFNSTLNELFRMAVAKPITVSIVGAVSGALSGNGTAQAGAGGAGGGDLANLAGQVPWGSMMPSGMTGGILGGINGWGASAMPSLFAPNAGIAAVNAGTAAPSQVISAIQGGHSGIAGAGGTSTLLGTLGAGAGGLGLGMMAGSMLGPLLAPKMPTVQAGITYGTGAGAGIGAMIGSVIPGIGTIVGGLIGGLLGGGAGAGIGGLFGGYKDDPGLWTATNLDLTRGTSGADMEALAKDKKHPWAWYTHKDDDGYLVQSRNRHGMKKEAAEQATAYMEEVAQQALGLSDKVVEGMGGINASLGTAYKQSLESFKWTRVAADWEDEEPKLEDLGKQLLKNTQDNIYNALMGTDMSSLMKADDGAIADTADEIVGTVMDAISVLALGAAFEDKGAEYVNKMGKKLADGYSGTGIDISNYLSADLNNLTTGMVESLAAAVTAINGMQAGIKQIQSPLSAVEQQAEAAKKQLDEYAKALEKSGLNQKWAAGIIEDYRKAVVDDYIKKLNESIHPASALSTTMKNVNDSVTQTITAMKMMAATSEELAQIESQRNDILMRAYENATLGFHQDYATRYATVTGGDKDSVAAIIARENELKKIEEQFGKGVDWSKTYEQKIANLNAEKYQGRSDWNEALLDKAIADAGLTRESWYEMYGEAEKVVAPTGNNDDNYIYTLLQKAALLNAEKYQGRTNWDVESVDKAIAEAGLTRESWYEKHGKNEGLEGPTDYYAQIEALQKAEEARRALDALQAQQNKYLQEQVQLSQKLVNSWQGVVDALNDTRSALHRENTDPARGFAAAQAEFDELYAKALGGDSDAAAKMGQIGSELLAMGKKNSADQYIYQQLFNDIDRKLFDSGIYAAKEFDAAQAQLDLMNAQLGAQQTANDLSAELLKAQNTLNAALAGLAAPKPEYKPEPPKKPEVGSDEWKRSVMQNKVADLNASKYMGKNTWSIAALEEEIKRVGLTFDTWYKMYGKAEGYATGGVTPANTPFWVGERGPELMMTPQQYGVLSNADSLNMLARVSAASYADDYAAPYAKGFTTSRIVTAPTNMAMLTRMPAAASDGGATAALHAALNEMRDEIKSLRQDNKNLLGQVVKHTKGVLDESVEARTTGMPIREYKAPPMHVINFPE